jgi:hypothetical protein
MFGLLGSKESGVSPESCWPDADTLRHYREWEKVFHDGLTFEELIQRERQKHEEAVRKEEQLTDGLKTLKVTKSSC